MQPNYNQTNIIEKMELYLKANRRDTSFLTKRGYCSGISTLWLYAKWLQTQPKTSDKPRDDYDWFKTTVELIANWDGKRKLDTKESSEFERFISYIEFFQNIMDYLPIGQPDLDKSLEYIKYPDDTKKDKEIRIPSREYSIASLFTLEQLKQVLNTENVIQEFRCQVLTTYNAFVNGSDQNRFCCML